MNNNFKKLVVHDHFIVAVHRPSHKVVRAFFLTRNSNFLRFDGMFVRFFKSHIFAPELTNSVDRTTSGRARAPRGGPILSETRSACSSSNSQLRHAPFRPPPGKFSPTSSSFDVRIL